MVYNQQQCTRDEMEKIAFVTYNVGSNFGLNFPAMKTVHSRSQPVDTKNLSLIEISVTLLLAIDHYR